MYVYVTCVAMLAYRRSSLFLHCSWSSLGVAMQSSILTASRDGAAKLWNFTTGECLMTFRGLRGHRGQVTGAMFSPDQSLVLTASADGTAKIWTSDANEGLFKVPDAFVMSHIGAMSGAMSRPMSLVCFRLMGRQFSWGLLERDCMDMQLSYGTSQIGRV